MAFEGETIGEWTVDRLIRFLEQQRDENPPNQIPTLVCDDLTVAGKLTLRPDCFLTVPNHRWGGRGRFGTPRYPLGLHQNS